MSEHAASNALYRLFRDRSSWKVVGGSRGGVGQTAANRLSLFRVLFSKLGAGGVDYIV